MTSTLNPQHEQTTKTVGSSCQTTNQKSEATVEIGKKSTFCGRLFYRIYGKKWSELSPDEKKEIICDAVLKAITIAALITATAFGVGAVAMATMATAFWVSIVLKTFIIGVMVGQTALLLSIACKLNLGKDFVGDKESTQTQAA